MEDEGTVNKLATSYFRAKEGRGGLWSINQFSHTGSPDLRVETVYGGLDFKQAQEIARSLNKLVKAAQGVVKKYLSYTTWEK